MLNWILSRKIFILRTVVFASAVIISLAGKEFAAVVFNYQVVGNVRVFHLLWVLLMFEMALALIPGLNHFIGRGKIFKLNYIHLKHDITELLSYTKKFDRRAILAALVWAVALILIGLLRLDSYWVVMSAFLFYFLDQLFVNLWCPFQNWIVHNRCCATCRIYSWGFPIIVSPLIYLKSFWSYSLVAMGALLLFQWELLHYKYPERFSELSNAALACKYCNDRCSKSSCSSA